MSDLRITGLHKSYGAVQAVRGIDLDIPAGEFAVLVGPSGCGKSTLLRTIAGLEEADAGSIEIGGRAVDHVRPRDRDIAMVFQSYALYPYLTVYENIAFGLRARRTPAPEVEARVKRAAEMLEIGPLLARLPRELSGGQRQRVAIGRAIVRDARLYLFDEPLSNLDAQLRDEMRVEIKRLHREIGRTMVYVTHDQIEAMTLADRIVLLKDGRIEQQGSPLELFEHPLTRFVAGFLGSPRMNFLPATLVAGPRGLDVDVGGTALAWPGDRQGEIHGAVARSVELGLRPEHLRRAGSGPPVPGEVRLPVKVELVQPTGSRTFVTASIGGRPVIAEVGAHDVQRPGETIELALDMRRAILFDPATGSVFGNDNRVKTAKETTMAGPTRAIKLFGTEASDPKGRVLKAGALSAMLDNGALRYVRVGESEVIRAIAFLVRDENWGTFTPAVEGLEVQESADGFSVSYRARCADEKRAISYAARIVASATGGLSFEAEATPETDVLTNRTGFIVLHPLQGVAGRPLTIEHVDGRVVRSEFPAVIDPDCPFRDVRALTHEVSPGLSVTCRMEGDTFEMEDHRNWMDASFKTYVRPLSRPWPYTLPKGESFKQRISLEFSGPLPAPAVSGSGKTLSLRLGARVDRVMPRVGLGVAAEEAAPALAAAALVKDAGPQLLVCQLDGRRSDGGSVAKTFRALSEATGAGVVLEVIVPGMATPASELEPVRRAVGDAGLKLAAVTVSPAAHLKAVLPGSKGPDVPTFEETYAAARAAFPGVPLGGGMYSYFTELNRIRPPAGLLDFVTHTNAPIVHAADDVSVMETLGSLPFIIQSTRTFIAGRPYRVGPSAIPARDNPYGKACAENPGNGRVCLARMDPRQRGLFGAAWTLGYMAAFASGGIEVVTVGAPTGASGVIARRTDYAQPYFDAAPEHALYPVFHVVKGFAGAAGLGQHALTNADPSRLAAIVYAGRKGPILWVANLTGETQMIAVDGFDGGTEVSVLDEEAFVAATREPDFMRAAARPVASGALKLGAYAVARVASP